MSPTPPTPELPRLRLGYIPLTDAAPLVVALENGHFERFGLDVSLSRQPSWATLRDSSALVTWTARTCWRRWRWPVRWVWKVCRSGW